jgi:hypothetical protein
LTRPSRKQTKFIPHFVDADSGVSRQVAVADINGDKSPDVIVGSTKGVKKAG